jgi:predicted RND superfamily exporter protein
MIIHLLQPIITLIPIIIALVIQMTVHHLLQIREDVMGAVVVEIKKPFCSKGF